MNMKDYYSPELLKLVTQKSINDYFDKFDTHRKKMVEKIKLSTPAIDFTYESPIVIDHLIENIAEEESKEINKLTYKAIMQVGVRVDKEELIKALAYDRNQYSKGFEDGFKAGKKARWINVEQGLPNDEQKVWAIDEGGHLYQDTYPWDDCGTIKWYGDGCFDVPIVKWMEKPEEEQNDAD